ADRRDDGSVSLNISLCERACEPFGLGVEDDSRSLTLAILGGSADYTAGARHTYGAGLDGFAVHRPRTTEGHDVMRRTLLDQMITGSEVTLEPFELTPGATVR